jgi:hypothetical protein
MKLNTSNERLAAKVASGTQLLSVTDLKACPIREWISAIRVCDVLFGWIDP